MPDSTSEELPEGYFEVERVVDGRKYRGRWEFLVKWVGYGHNENSWVLEDDFGTDCMDMIREWKAKQKKPKKAKPEKAPPVSYNKRLSKRSASSSSSNEQTDSLSDDNVPLSNRLRSRKTKPEDVDDKPISKSKKSEDSSPTKRKTNTRSLVRMDTIQNEVSKNLYQAEPDSEGHESEHPTIQAEEAIPVECLLSPEPEVANVAAPESIVEDILKDDIKMVEEPVESVQQLKQSATVTEDVEPAVETPTVEIENPVQTNLSEVPESEQNVLQETIAPDSDPNADLEQSVFWRELAPEGRFPVSVSEICNMMGSLDEHGRIELIDHLTFRFGHAEMFVLISTQRPFLRKFEQWLIEAYKSGSPISIAFIRSALTLMSIFPGSKYANYRRLVRVIREWFVVDPVCINLAGRVLKQWEYHRDISQTRGANTINHSISPTNALGDSPVNAKDSLSVEPIPAPVRHPPMSKPTIVPTPARTPVFVPASHTPPPLSVDIDANERDTSACVSETVDVVASPDLKTPSISASIESSPTNMDIVMSPTEDLSMVTASADSNLNQVEIEQDSSITYMPAGIDDDLEYAGDDGSAWMTTVLIP